MMSKPEDGAIVIRNKDGHHVSKGNQMSIFGLISKSGLISVKITFLLSSAALMHLLRSDYCFYA